MAWKTKHLHSASAEAYFEFLINGYSFMLPFAVMIACRGRSATHFSSLKWKNFINKKMWIAAWAGGTGKMVYRSRSWPRAQHSQMIESHDNILDFIIWFSFCVTRKLCRRNEKPFAIAQSQLLSLIKIASASEDNLSRCIHDIRRSVHNWLFWKIFWFSKFREHGNFNGYRCWLVCNF